MKYNSFLTRACMLVVCAGLIFISCKDDLEMSVSSNNETLDSYPDTVHIDVKSNVRWAIESNSDWLIVSPMEGRGNGTLSISATENPEFYDRTAKIVISGIGVRTDTISILQTRDFDIFPSIVDTAFRRYVLDRFDKYPKDGMISQREARNVDTIIVSSRQIQSLEGIEHFTQLIHLDCEVRFAGNDSSVKLKRLDVSKNTKLRILNCIGNDIETLDVTANKELRRLFCSFNPITNLDISGLTELIEVEVFSADLQGIDVGTNTGLRALLISNNERIRNLNLSNNLELRDLQCNRTGLTNLDISNNSELMILYCANNQLSSLNISSNTKLQHLNCDENQFSIPTINTSNNPALISLSCRTNRFTSLDVSRNINLEYLYCDNNRLESLNLSQNAKLLRLNCQNNNINGIIDLSNIRLGYLHMNFLNNPRLHTIEVPKGFIQHATDNPQIFKDTHTQWVEKP